MFATKRGLLFNLTSQHWWIRNTWSVLNYRKSWKWETAQFLWSVKYPFSHFLQKQFRSLFSASGKCMQRHCGVSLRPCVCSSCPGNLHFVFFFYLFFAEACEKTGYSYKIMLSFLAACHHVPLLRARACMCDWEHTESFPSNGNKVQWYKPSQFAVAMVTVSGFSASGSWDHNTGMISLFHCS